MSPMTSSGRSPITWNDRAAARFGAFVMRMSAVVLASGASSRFGPGDKLAALLHGKPVIRHVLDTVRPLGLHQVALVTGPGSSLPALAEGQPLLHVVNHRHAEGMGTSIAAGLAALDPCAALFVLLGDMPFIDTVTCEEMRDRFAQAPTPDIIAPSFEGRRGHPVLFGARCFGELAGLEGDRGAAGLIASGRYDVEYLAVSTPAILRDIDTPEDLREAESR